MNSVPFEFIISIAGLCVPFCRVQCSTYKVSGCRW